MKKIWRSFSDFPFHTPELLRIRIGWYINLRWLAVFALLITIPIGTLILDFDIGYHQLVFFAALLLQLNIVYFFFYRYLPLRTHQRELIFAEIQILIDLVLLSVLIHFSGGIENPFFILYFVQAIFSAILFPGSILPFSNALFAALLITAWTFLEYAHIVHHYTLGREPMPVNQVITALMAFYVTLFAGIFIINDFMYRYRELKRKIDEKNLLLEKAIRDRNRLFRYTAHEIKSPVTTIKSTLAVLKKLCVHTIPAEHQDLLNRVEKRSDQVLSMIKEMLDITHYNLATEKPEVETVDITDWLKRLVDAFQNYAEFKEINLRFEDEVHHFTHAMDTYGLEKVASNLISNALRYTPSKGTVTVSPFLWKSEFGFSVSDTGIGIDKEDLPHIFDEFFRSKEAREMEQIGTGLGLSLADEIVKKNGGVISVESAPGKGSRFTVTLPLRAEGQEDDIHIN